MTACQHVISGFWAFLTRPVDQSPASSFTLRLHTVLWASTPSASQAAGSQHRRLGDGRTRRARCSNGFRLAWRSFESWWHLIPQPKTLNNGTSYALVPKRVLFILSRMPVRGDFEHPSKKCQSRKSTPLFLNALMYGPKIATRYVLGLDRRV